MSRGYTYKKPVNRSHYSNFRRRILFALVFLMVVGGVGFFIFTNVRTAPQSSQLSAVETTEITGNKTTFTNDYFQFEDSGKWILAKKNSSANRLVYDKYRKNVLEAEMIVYINQVPIPLYLDTPRVLPLRIVNDNSFMPTNVSSACVGNYAKGELHKVKEISINGATMLCDPDSPQYFVILSEINGDYRLRLKRPNGAPIQFIITYKDLGLDPQPDSLINIAGSFKTR